MANCNIEMKGCDPKIIAKELRRTANGFDPWHDVKTIAVWFIIGGVMIASMDYGDVWLCVGQCNAASLSTQ